MSDNKMLVYGQKDIETIMLFLNNLTVTGVAAARQISVVASILESGKDLEKYLNVEKTDN